MNNLKMYRLASGITQKELSIKTEIDIRLIQAYEQQARDLCKANVITVLKLANALNCSVEELLNIK